jgi:hypothetical protein
MAEQAPVIRTRIGPDEGALPAAPVVEAVRLWLAVLDDLTASLQPGQQRIQWEIQSVSMASPLDLALRVPEAQDATARRASRAYQEGIQALAQGASDPPPHFREDALRDTRRLATLATTVLHRAQFSTEDITVAITPGVAVAADRLLQTVREQVSTVEGRVETLTVHDRNLMRLWDPVTGQAIECQFPDSRLNDVRSAFGRRAQVSGRVRYNAFGRPLSVQLEHLRIIREQDELPQARDLEGISITGGLLPTDYLRGVRDGGRETGILG